MADNNVRIVITADSARAAAALKELEQKLSSVGTATKGTEQKTKDLGTAGKKTSSELKEMGQKSKTTESSVKGLGTTSKTTTSSLKTLAGAAGLMGVVYSAGRMATQIVTTGATFEQQMATVKGVTRATESEFEAMEAAAKKMGSETEWSASQSAEALQFLGMAGFNASQSVDALPGVLDLATASGIDLGRAADIASNALTAMGLQTQDLSRVNDVLVATITSSNVNMEMMAESFKYAAPVAHAYGVDVEELSALIGTLGNAGIQGSMAGTQLAAAFQDAGKVFDKYGVSAVNADGSSKGLMEAVQLLKDRGAGASEVMEIFGERAGRAALVLMDSVPTYEKLTKVTNDAKGATTQLADTMRDTVQGAFKEYGSAVESVQIKLFQRYEEMIKDSALFSADYVRNLNNAIDGMDLWLTDLFAVFDQTWAMLERDLDTIGVQITSGASLLWTDVGVLFTAGVTGIQEEVAGLLNWLADVLGDFEVPSFLPGAETINASVDALRSAAVEMKADASATMKAAVAEEAKILDERNKDLKAIEDKYSAEYARIQATRQACYEDILGTNVKSTKKANDQIVKDGEDTEDELGEIRDDDTKDVKSTLKDQSKLVADAMDSHVKAWEDAQEEKEDLLDDFNAKFKKLTTSEYELAQESLEAQAKAYKEAGADKHAVDLWLASETAKINEEMEKDFKASQQEKVAASDDFVAGMIEGLNTLTERQRTWGATGIEIMEDFASNSRAAVSDMLFDAVTGDLDSLEQYWDATWKSMLQSMTNTVADMAVSWASSNLIGWGGDFLTSLIKFHDGTTGIQPDEMLAVLQKGEMVIPAKQSEAIRGAINSGEGMSKADFFDSVTDHVQAGSMTSWDANASIHAPDVLGMMLGDVVGTGIRSVGAAYNNYSMGMDMVDNLKASGLSFDEAAAESWVKDQAIAGAMSNFVTNLGAQMMGDLVNYGMGFTQENIAGMTVQGVPVTSAKIGGVLATGLAGLIGGPVGTLSMAVASPVLSAGVSGLADLFDLRENESYRDYIEDELGEVSGRQFMRDVSALTNAYPTAEIDLLEAFSRYSTPELRNMAIDQVESMKDQLSGGLTGAVSRASHLMGKEFSDEVMAGNYSPDIEAAFRASVQADPGFYSYDTREYAGLNRDGSSLGGGSNSETTGTNRDGTDTENNSPGGGDYGGIGGRAHGGLIDRVLAANPADDGLVPMALGEGVISRSGMQFLDDINSGRVPLAMRNQTDNRQLYAALVSIAKYCQKSMRVLQRWDQNGIPQERVQ